MEHIKFNNEIKQKAFDYVYSRVITADREVREHDNKNYAMVDQEVLDMMKHRKEVELAMYKYMLQKLSK